MDFPGSDRGVDCLRDGAMTIDVVGSERLFDPPRLVFLHGPDECHGFVCITPSVVGVECYTSAGSAQRPRQLHPCDIRSSVEASDLDLDVAEPELAVMGHFALEIL